MRRIDAASTTGTALARARGPFAALARCTRGATAIEYGIIAASIAVVILASVRITGTVVLDLWTSIADSL